MSEAVTKTQSQRVGLICLLLAVLTFAVYARVLRFDYVDYDDTQYICDNPVVSKGLTAAGARWAFTSTQPNYLRVKRGP